MRRRLCDVFKTSSRHLWRRLRDVLENKRLLSGRRLQDVFKIFLQDVFKTYLKDVSKRCLQGVFKKSWRLTKIFSRKESISASNKFKCASDRSKSNKSISDKSKVHPRTNLICINKNLIILIFIAFWNLNSISILRFKISRDCLVLGNQPNKIHQF